LAVVEQRNLRRDTSVVIVRRIKSWEKKAKRKRGGVKTKVTKAWPTVAWGIEERPLPSVKVRSRRGKKGRKGGYKVNVGILHCHSPFF